MPSRPAQWERYSSTFRERTFRLVEKVSGTRLEEYGPVPKTVRMDTGRRWLAVGRCADADPRRAGREAARRALVDTNPALLVVFCSGQSDPAEVLAGID